IVLPDRSGCELADCITELQAVLPVLFMSGYLDDAAELARMDQAVLLQKPFRPRDLTARIRAVLDNR
ncbi:MAG: hybrid sensor histidine kinase/response regulator, partial [Deltaproteobacteria bacterium]|nr:hybrid sensor histidine kinase/response regulator [Deltaproteobacteria bacterium]